MADVQDSQKMEQGCAFCGFASGFVGDGTLLFKDNVIAVFRDHKPAASHHYLVIPIHHVKDAKQLRRSDIPLVEAMKAAGQRVLEEQGGSMESARLGFHWPPFMVMQHLHLHIISPPSEMGWLKSILYRSYTPWFADIDWLLKHLQAKSDS